MRTAITTAVAHAFASASPAAIGRAAALSKPLSLAKIAAEATLGAYPKVPRGTHVDDYFGVKVADPYRRLEDDAKAAKAFDKAQMKLTRAYLDTLPARSAFVDYLTKAYAQPEPATTIPFGKDALVLKRSPGDGQSKLYVRSSADGSMRLLFDPIAADPSKDATMAFGGLSPNPNGKTVAVGISDNGSDWVTWQVIDARTGKQLDTVRWVKDSSVAWLPDGSGFYYAGLPKPQKGRELLEPVHDMSIKLHKLGTDQNDDVVVYATADRPAWTHSITADADAKLEVIESDDMLSLRKEILVRPLGSTEPFKNVWSTDKGVTQVVDILDATHLRLRTYADAPNGKILDMDISVQPPVLKEVLPEDKEAVLQSAQFAGSYIYATYLVQGSSSLRVYHNGQVQQTVQLPDQGTASGFRGDAKGKSASFSFQNMYMPTTGFSVDLKTGERSVTNVSDITVDSSQYVTDEEYFKSTDGTLVPMWVTRRRDTARDGNAPTLLYAYGGFDADITPMYTHRYRMWLDAGGVVAIPQLRGGGELGENWHRQGVGARKQNVFEDFKAAARHLVEQKITTPSKLTIAGDSNGGYLMGAMATQAPDMFACILAGVGVQDQLRYPLYTWGPGWIPEYGDAAHDERAFKNLIGLSPVHNVRKGVKYPAIMVCTATDDDRVAPMHSRKFAAALQWAQAGTAPVLYRIDKNAGHGGGKPTTKLIEQVADQYAFAFHAMGCDDAAAKLKARMA